jgi:hypothetical protein
LDKLEFKVGLALKLIAYDAGYEDSSGRRDALDASSDVDGVADYRAYGRNKQVSRIDPDPRRGGHIS